MALRVTDIVVRGGGGTITFSDNVTIEYIFQFIQDSSIPSGGIFDVTLQGDRANLVYQNVVSQAVRDMVEFFIDGTNPIFTDLTVAGSTALNGAVSLGATDQALILNRLTTTQRDLLTPVAGMLIFNTTLARLQEFDGTGWQEAGGVLHSMQLAYDGGGIFDLAVLSPSPNPWRMRAADNTGDILLEFSRGITTLKAPDAIIVNTAGAALFLAAGGGLGNANGGPITLNAGPGSGSGVAGPLNLGIANTSAILSGSGSTPWTHSGTLGLGITPLEKLHLSQASGVTTLRHDNTSVASITNVVRLSHHLKVTTTGLVEASRIETKFTDIGETTNDSKLTIFVRRDDALLSNFTIGGGNTAASLFLNTSANVDLHLTNASTCRMVIQSSGTGPIFFDLLSIGTGDPQLRFATNNIFRWNFGADTSAGAELIWANSSDLNTNERMKLTTAGRLLVDSVDSTGGVAQAGIYIINSTASMGGALTNSSVGRWEISTQSGIARFGSVIPAATGLQVNGVVNLVTESTNRTYAVGNAGVSAGSVVTLSMWTAVSTDHGSIPAPRMTTAQRDAITVGAAQDGLQAYNTTTNTLDYFDGGALVWRSMAVSPVLSTQASTAVSATTAALGTADVYRGTVASITITISKVDIKAGRVLGFKARSAAVGPFTPVTIKAEDVTINSVALAGGSGSDFTAAATHNFAVGTTVVHTGFSDPTYNGTFVVTAISSTTVYEIAAITFNATDAGTANAALDGVGSIDITVDYGSVELRVTDTLDFESK